MVLIFAKVIASSIMLLPNENNKKIVIGFFIGLHSIFGIITKSIVRFLPIGFFGFISTTIIEIRAGVDISGLWKFLFVIISANFVQGFLFLPILLKANGIAPFDSMKKMMPALVFAFFSKSSSATLPITMETAEKHLKISKPISQLALPICTAINMNGCAAFIFTTVIFFMQNSGVEITHFTLATWILISTLAAIGNAGVPMGCYFLNPNNGLRMR